MYTAEYFKDSEGNHLSPEEIAMMLNSMGKKPAEKPIMLKNNNLTVIGQRRIPMLSHSPIGMRMEDIEICNSPRITVSSVEVPVYKENIIETIAEMAHEALMSKNVHVNYFILGLDVFLTLQDQVRGMRYGNTDFGNPNNVPTINTSAGTVTILVSDKLGTLQMGFTSYTDSMRFL